MIFQETSRQPKATKSQHFLHDVVSTFRPSHTLPGCYNNLSRLSTNERRYKNTVTVQCNILVTHDSHTLEVALSQSPHIQARVTDQSQIEFGNKKPPGSTEKQDHKITKHVPLP